MGKVQGIFQKGHFGWAMKNQSRQRELLEKSRACWGDGKQPGLARA